MKTRIFFDMDGTLFEWRKATVEELYEPGYFASLKPNQSIVNIAKHFATCEPDFEAFTLSAVLPGVPHIIQDKNASLDMYLPEIDKDHRLYVHTGIPKHTVVPGGIRPTDIIIDDYTVNLLSWDQHAIGIKLLNGINHTRRTWKGACISIDDPYSLSVTKIKNILRAKQAEQNLQNRGKVVIMLDESNDVDAVVNVNNWDEAFETCFAEAVDKWNQSNDEFFDVVMAFLTEHGYSVEMLDYRVVRS